MQCPNCRGENPNGSTNCYYCGAPLMNQPYGQPYGQQPYGQQPYGAPQGNSALRGFGKSPMILVAMIAFAVVAVQNLLNFFDSFEVLELYLEMLGDEPLNVLGVLCGFFLFIPYALIAIGLFKIYSSNGRNESSLASSGFGVAAAMLGIKMGATYLNLLIEDSEAFFELFGDYVLIPVVVCVCAVIACLNAKKFVAGIGRAAAGGSANANEANSAGIWCIVYGGLLMLSFLGVFEEMGVANASELLEGLDLISYLCDVAGFIVLGVAAMNFKSLISSNR